MQKIRLGHVIDRLREMPDGSVQCVVTSPPYFGLRDYGLEPVIWEPVQYSPMPGMPVMAVPGHANPQAYATCEHDWGEWSESHDVREKPISGKTRTTDRSYGDASRRFDGNHQKHSHGRFCRICGAWRGCLGLEPSPELYIGHLVQVFRELRRVLREDGTLWLNLGDSYASGNMATRDTDKKLSARGMDLRPSDPPGIKPKDLMGIPWRAAFALQADGWFLRSDVVWHKCLSGGVTVYAKDNERVFSTTIKDLVRHDLGNVSLWDGGKWNPIISVTETATNPERKNRKHMEYLEIVLRSGERIGCTENHRWPTHRGVLETKELQVGDILESCELPDSSYDVPGFLIDDAFWLAGLFLAEGSYSAQTLQISLNADESCWFERISNVARHYGSSCNKYRYGNGLHISINGGITKNVLESIVVYQGSYGSHLHHNVWMFPNRLLRLIASGYLDGDGGYDEQNNRYRLGFARNYSLERDLRTLAARLGAVLTLKPTLSISTNNGKSFPCFRGEWRWTKPSGMSYKPRTEVVAIARSRARKFYDIVLKNDPHLFSLSSGVLTHNSNPMPESVTDRPTRSHEMLFLLTKNQRYFYDHVAIREPHKSDSIARIHRGQGPVKVA